MLIEQGFEMKKLFYFLFLFLFLGSCSSCQNKKDHPGKRQYPIGYPLTEAPALEQLSSYPVPRYLPGNHLLRLFNWINPKFLGSEGKNHPNDENAKMLSYLIQKELITNWNYGVVIAHAGVLFNGRHYGPYPKEIQLANEHPEVPLDVITFWTQGCPKEIGYKPVKPMIRDLKTDSAYDLTFSRDGEKYTEIKFNFPDSLIHIDGEVQKYYLSNILKYLTRPINRINENGEEAPGPYLVDYIQNDKDMVSMKNAMKIDSWEDFVSTRKLQMRNVYSSAFMKELPQLKNTSFNFYITEGGPIDRFEWHIMKHSMTPVDGRYYSTPDFYPRWPKNWKDWTGAWHGWRWISIGRKTEIKDGDPLFSPFVAAGWSNVNEDNITPGQWLGLLKCLSAVGAEYYYVGYFNLGAPFNDPADYIWQAAMPGYAQAITSRFEDVLKNGNVLFDDKKQPIINYPVDDKHVLVTARKANGLEKYVICGTYQPFSNDSDEIPESRNVSVTINGHNLSFEIRRQGSVYIYEKTPDNRSIFYQLDKWHENAHPDRWSKDFYVEAEVADSGISSNDIYTVNKGNEGDYTDFISYIKLSGAQKALYHFDVRDSVNKAYYIWVHTKGESTISVALVNSKGTPIELTKKLNSPANWEWSKIEVPKDFSCCGNNTITMSSAKGELDLDKFVVTTKELSPPKL
jgi:hypothetical protein